MSKIYLIISNDINDKLITSKIDINNELEKKFNLKTTSVPTPIIIENKTRDIVQYIDTLMNLADIYDFLKYSKNIIKLVQMTKARYLKIYKKNKDNKLEATINIDDKDYMEQISTVIEDSSDYIFEFLTSEEI